MPDLADLPTPTVTIDRAITRHNLIRMADRARAHGLALCPHIKTHKNPALAHEQMTLGASAIMVSKLGEAAVMLEAGIANQFIGYPLVDALHEVRLTALVREGLRPRVAVDSAQAADLLRRVADDTGVSIPVLIEVDTGFHRCGLEDPDAILALALRIRDSGLPFYGITCFGGHITHRVSPERIRALLAQESSMLDRVRRKLETAGFGDLIVSEGGTVPAAYVDHMTAATEMRPGTYVFNDVATVAAHAAEWEDCAARVVTQVVSSPAADRAVLDAGAKTLAGDGPVDESFGRIVERPDLRVERLSEEHAVVARRGGGPTGLNVGDRLTVIPNHVCTMVNLHDRVTLVEGRTVVGELEIRARGMVR
jgi:D-serine deaminase-like pyridoxal phosphate-dependent protein